MRRTETEDWRVKVNPIFTVTVLALRVISRLFRQLGQNQIRGDADIQATLLDGCEKAMSLLPSALAAPPEKTSDWVEQFIIQTDNKWLADPAVCQALSQLADKFESVPETLREKGVTRPHWWITQHSWSEFLQKPNASESLLNALALLQLQMPLRELTHRIAEGDARVCHKVFSSRNEVFTNSSVAEKLLQPFKDDATKIVGRALLRKGDPPGYQLPLRMILFFGWDFGLRDLSIPQLYRFLVEMDIIPESYEEQTLRKFRDRLRDLIQRTSRNRLCDTTGQAIRES